MQWLLLSQQIQGEGHLDTCRVKCTKRPGYQTVLSSSSCISILGNINHNKTKLSAPLIPICLWVKWTYYGNRVMFDKTSMVKQKLTLCCWNKPIKVNYNGHKMLWMKEVSRYLSLRWVPEGSPIPQEHHRIPDSLWDNERRWYDNCLSEKVCSHITKLLTIFWIIQRTFLWIIPCAHIIIDLQLHVIPFYNHRGEIDLNRFTALTQIYNKVGIRFHIQHLDEILYHLW